MLIQQNPQRTALRILLVSAVWRVVGSRQLNFSANTQFKFVDFGVERARVIIYC